MGLFDPAEPDKDEVLKEFKGRVLENEKQTRINNLFSARTNAKTLQDRIDAIKPNIVVDDKEGFTKDKADERAKLQEQLNDLLGAVKTFEETGDIEPLRAELKRSVWNTTITKTGTGFSTIVVSASSGFCTY